MEQTVVNEQMTVKELKNLLLQGGELASDLPWKLARADNRKVWDYVGLEDIEQRLYGVDIELSAQDVLDYMKNDFNLIDASGEADFAIETLWNEKISKQ